MPCAARQRIGCPPALHPCYNNDIADDELPSTGRLRGGIFLKTIEYNLEVHGFTGQLFCPDHPAATAVIVITGGAKGILSPAGIAQRFAELGFHALSFPLFGAAGQENMPDRIPLDYLEPALSVLKSIKSVRSVCLYGMSLGSIYALTAASMMEGIDAVISVSGCHVIPEGSPDRKTGSGHSLLTYHGMELPFVPIPVTGEMNAALRSVDPDDELFSRALIPLQQAGCRILILASDADETWPAAESAVYLRKLLKKTEYSHPYQVIIYKNASHILGILPEEDAAARMKRFSRIMYTSMLHHSRECLKAITQSQEEILSFLKNRGRKENND